MVSLLITANLVPVKSENPFSLKAHNYYPAYHTGPDFLTEKSRHYGILILFMKTFYNVVNAITYCAKEERALIVLDIE